MNNFYYKSFCFLGILLSLSMHGFNQNTRILGTIKDSISGEVLPFVNIALKGTSSGTSSDFEGFFKLESTEDTDSLYISSIGYRPKSIAIKSGQFQELIIELAPINILLSEVIILPGENPAEILLRKVIDNKINNNPDRIPFYDVDVYNTVQIDANNISDDFRNRRSMQKFQWIFDYADTSMINGKIYLPMFLTESVSHIYFRKSPKSKLEFIEAVRVSGVKNESISRYLGNMYQNINLYNNHISIFDKNFISPIANFGLAYYKYYLVDSSFIDKDWCYKIMFKPRRKQETTFSGHMWIHDSSFAIRKYEMRIVEDANINFVNDMIIEQSYNRFDSGQWMTENEKLIIDFNVLQKNQKSTMGFYGRKSTSYKNYTFNKTRENSFYNKAERVIIAEDANNKPDSYWNLARHDSLSEEESGIYEMLDSITEMPTFKTYIDIVNMILTGYYVWGKFEIGPYASMLSFNQIEGTRFRFGGRTSNDLSNKIMPSAYIAYGSKDEKFKYGGGFIWMLNKHPRKVFEIKYKHDMEQLGMSPSGFREDYFLASFITRNPADKLTMVNELKTYYEHEWFTGFSNTIDFIHKDIFPIGDTVFNFGENGINNTYKLITSSEIGLKLRFAYKEKYVYGEFERSSFGSNYPILQIKYSIGIKDLWNANFNYQRLNININDWFNIGALGWSKYIIDAGKIWGTLPYPFLKLHEGNETYFFDEAAFNSMNYFEFVSDEWLSIYYTHHFDGLFFNHIPLLKKLKWREVIWGKSLFGRLSERNSEYSSFPDGMYRLSKPYFETGIGIENIFKFLRVDAVWRMSYPEHPNIAKFHIIFGLQIFF